jgi:hypothetical protein
MEKTLFVYIEDSLCKLFGYEANLVLLQFDALLLTLCHKFVQIFFDILKYEIGLVDDSDNLFKFDNVGVIHLPQSFNFRQLQTLLPSAIFLLQSFDRQNLFSFFVLDFFYISK